MGFRRTAKAILTDAHFLIPFLVLCFGCGLLAIIH